MIPLDVILAPNLLTAMLEWRKPKWADAGAPWPGLQKAADAWRSGEILRKIKREDDASHPA